MLKFVMTPLFLLTCQVAFCQQGKTKIKVTEGTAAVANSNPVVYNKPVTKQAADKVEDVTDVPEMPKQTKPKSAAKEMMASAKAPATKNATPAPDVKPEAPAAKPEYEAITTTNADGSTVTILRIKKKVDTVATAAVDAKAKKGAKSADKKAVAAAAKAAADSAAKLGSIPLITEPKVVPPKIVRTKIDTKIPGTVWVGKGDYDMLTVQEIRTDPKLYMKGYTVDSFEVYYVPKANDYVLSYIISGNNFINDRNKMIFDQVESGDKLLFKKIYASDATGKNNPPIEGLSAVIEIIQ